VAEGFAGPDGVVLRTTLEEQTERVVPGPDMFGESEVLLRGIIKGLQVLGPGR
jgi:hypothetical protein